MVRVCDTYDIYHLKYVWTCFMVCCMVNIHKCATGESMCINYNYNLYWLLIPFKLFFFFFACVGSLLLCVGFL